MKQKLKQCLNHPGVHKWLMLVCLVSLGFAIGKVYGSMDSSGYCPSGVLVCGLGDIC